jgi:hypothetical protein
LRFSKKLPYIYEPVKNNPKGGKNMGFTKYAEDNFEIMEERRYWMQARETAPTLLTAPQTTLTAEAKETTKQPAKTKEKKKTRKLVCCECGTSFLFTGGEQHYYESHKLSEPKRCSTCRKARKQQINTHKEKQA